MSTTTQRKASKEATTSGMGSVKSTSGYNYSLYIYPNPVVSQLIQDMRFDIKFINFILKNQPSSFEICINQKYGRKGNMTHELSLIIPV